MKPRSERERHVMKLSGRIPAMTKAQESYAIKHCFEHNAIKRKKYTDEYICLECGEMFTADSGAEQVVCPHCHIVLKPQVTRRQYAKHLCESFQILTTIEDFQVVRTFYVRQITIPGKPAEYLIDEVSRIFIQQGKKDIAIALARRGLSRYVDAYIWDSELRLRIPNDAYYIGASVVYPRSRILPVLVRNGWCKELMEYNPFSTIERLLSLPRYETLAKAKRFDVWTGMTEYDTRKWWPQIKMLIRHGYYPSDVGMWKDTLNMAEECGLDIHSPKYVLPEDLKAMHDKLNNILQAKRRKEAERLEKEREREKQEQRKRNVRYNEEYKKRYGSLLAVVIRVGDITIKPLQNYAEFVEEGEVMHHCVETYWKNKSSLILSARSGEERLATIELGFKEFDIRQCRAVCNEKPKRYDEICTILKAHKSDFIKARKAQLINYTPCTT